MNIVHSTHYGLTGHGDIIEHTGGLTEPRPTAPLMPRTRKTRRKQAHTTAKTIVRARRKERADRARSQIANLDPALAARSYSRADLDTAYDTLPDGAPLADVLTEAARLADTRKA